MIKNYTDLEQSKKLAEILSLESADMSYSLNFDSGIYEISTVSYKNWVVPKYAQPDDGFGQVIPCWSLASLLGVLPKNLNIGRPSLESNYKGYYWIQYYDGFMLPNNYKTEVFNNPVDACVAMVELLHELEML